MPDRTRPSPTLPYTVLSCAVSLDGFLDDASERPLTLSGPADLDRVDEVRAGSDAILVGAVTVRNDDPRLLVRSSERRAARVASGRAPSPLKVTVTAHAKLGRDARFFTAGHDGGAPGRIVYCSDGCVGDARLEFGDLATVVDGGPRVTMRAVAEDLGRRGVRRLLVEGGASVHTQFLAEGLADELHLALAPFFLGDDRARRWLGGGAFPWGPQSRARLLEARPVGDIALVRYGLSDRCPPGSGS